MSRSVYMPTRSYSSNDLVKTAQARGLVDRFIEATYFGGRRLESKSTVFGTMMNELRNIDNKIRATLLNKTISKQTPYPNENMGSAEELLENAQSAYDSKEYLLAISYLEQFYVKVLYCAQLLKNLDSIVAELNKEYYKSLLEPLKEDQIERIKKFLKDKKEAAYLPEDTRKDIEEGKANIEGKLNVTTSARYRLNKKAGFYKQAGLISWVQGLFNPREAALTLWERIQPGASKDLKRDIGRVLSASNRLFNVFKNSLETMSSARANREIAKYQTAAKTIPAQVNSYSELVNEANFNKYTEQLNEVLASIATPQQAAKVQQNPSPDASVLAAQVASGNTSSPVGAPVVYSIGSGKNIDDFKQGQRVYVVKDNASILATVNNVDKNNKVSVNIDGFPGPILLNPDQIFTNDAAIVIENAVSAGAVSAPVDASDPAAAAAAAAAVVKEVGSAVAVNINSAAAEPPKAPPEPVNPVNPAGAPPPGDGGGVAAPAGDAPADFSGAGGSGGDLTPLQKSIALKIYKYMVKDPNEDKLAMYIAALFGSGWSHKQNIGPRKLIDEVGKKIEEYKNSNLLDKYVDKSSSQKVFYIKKPSLKDKNDGLTTDDVYGIKEYFDLAQKDLTPLESSNIPGNLLFSTYWEEGAGDAPAGGTPADAAGAGGAGGAGSGGAGSGVGDGTSDAPTADAPTADAGGDTPAGEASDLSTEEKEKKFEPPLKIKQESFTIDKISSVKNSASQEYVTQQNVSGEGESSQKFIPLELLNRKKEEVVKAITGIATDGYVQVPRYKKQELTVSNFKIYAARKNLSVYVTDTSNSDQFTFKFEESDEFGQPDPKSNEQTVVVDVDDEADEAGMKVEPENLDPNNTYEVHFTIENFIKNSEREEQKLLPQEINYYTDLLKEDFDNNNNIKIIITKLSIANNIVPGPGTILGKRGTTINFSHYDPIKKTCKLICLIESGNKIFNEKTQEMENFPESILLKSEIPFSEVEFYQLPTKSSSFTYALQALSNESPIIVASFIRRYANLIQNKNKKLSNNLHKIASRIK